MFMPEENLRIWLCTKPTDMRKSYDGLAAVAKRQLQEDPASGQLFVFVNRRKTQLKILYFDRTGYCIWSKRLIQGQFNFKPNPAGKTFLDMTSLRLIIDGIGVEKMRKYKRFYRQKQEESMAV